MGHATLAAASTFGLSDSDGLAHALHIAPGEARRFAIHRAGGAPGHLPRLVSAVASGLPAPSIRKALRVRNGSARTIPHSLRVIAAVTSVAPAVARQSAVAVGFSSTNPAAVGARAAAAMKLSSARPSIGREIGCRMMVAPCDPRAERTGAAPSQPPGPEARPAQDSALSRGSPIAAAQRFGAGAPRGFPAPGGSGACLTPRGRYRFLWCGARPRVVGAAASGAGGRRTDPARHQDRRSSD